MISETEFAELGNSLTTGFFADGVVITLARTQRLGKLQRKDRHTILEARRLFEQVLQGEKWLDNRKIDAKSAESALAFDRAVHALPQIRVPKDFVSYIDKLREIINDLLRKDIAPTENIQELRRFFYGFARAVSTESQRVIERSSKPQGVVPWPQPNPENI